MLSVEAHFIELAAVFALSFIADRQVILPQARWTVLVASLSLQLAEAAGVELMRASEHDDELVLEPVLVVDLPQTRVANTVTLEAQQ